MFTWNLEGYKMFDIQVANQKLHMNIIKRNKENPWQREITWDDAKNMEWNFFELGFFCSSYILLLFLSPLRSTPIATTKFEPVYALGSSSWNLFQLMFYEMLL
jgi:hypothetical protein